MGDAGNNPVTWPADATWGEWFSATWTASVGGYLSGLYKMATQSSWGEIGWSALNLASSVVVNAVDPFGVGRILVGMASGGTTIAGGEGRAGTVLDEIAQDLTDAQAGMADGLTMGIGSSLRELSGVHYADNSSPLYMMGNIAGQITSAVAMSILTGGAGAAAVAARAAAGTSRAAAALSHAANLSRAVRAYEMVNMTGQGLGMLAAAQRNDGMGVAMHSLGFLSSAISGLGRLSQSPHGRPSRCPQRISLDTFTPVFVT